jgi:2-keto-4-pentenoate hydratase/2-oxohepta-3-ene-1,7-dioic acid hydratase in catechol pathway
VLGKLMPLTHYKDINGMSFKLDINGKTVQEGNTKDVVFSFDTIIEYISGFITLRTGDLIYTGTPVGVGPVKIGDRLEAYLENEKLLDFEVK